MWSNIMFKGVTASLLSLISVTVFQGVGTVPVRVSEVRQLGCEICSGPEQFSVIQSIAVDSAGAIYVADRYAPFIRVWSPDGRLAAFVGQEGFGPGEFQRVSAIYPTAEGGFSAIDRRQRRWTFFGPQGDLLRTTALLGSITQSAFSKSENALYAAIRIRGSASCRTTEIRRWKVNAGSDSTVIAEIGDAPLAKFSGCPAAVYNLDTIPDGGFGLGFGFDEYVLFGFESNGLSRYQLIHEVARVPRTADEVDVERGRLMRIAGSGVVAEPDTFRSHFTGGALRYDSAGRAWVRTERGAGNITIFDIFSPQGDHLGEITLPMKVKSPGGSFDLAGDYLLTTHVDELSGVEFVKLWRVTWSR